jgi:ligand-binding SRPBCC domain-containing protein
MAAITPPPVRVQVRRAPQEIVEGEQMDFSLVVGPFKIPWLAVFENVTPHRFTDRQLQGPFQVWKHTHTFVALNEGRTQVLDEIELKLKWHPWWSLVGVVMAVSLPLLFAYRARKTRQLIQNRLAAAR